MKAILAAIDFSRVSDRVVAEAAALAHALGGKVVLTTVLVEPVYLKEYAPPPKSIAKITVDHERGVRNHLAAIREKLCAKGIPAEVVVRRGNAALQILAVADKHDAAIIVIGSHGHTAFFELVLGSTTQTVLKRARQPVLVIPKKMKKPGRMKP